MSTVTSAGTGTGTGSRPGTPRAVVTGLGITAPNGLGTEAYWDAVRVGKSGIGRITRFDPRSIRRGWPGRCRGSPRPSTCRAG